MLTASRGATCMECAILLGIFGSIIIVIAAVMVPKLESTYEIRGGTGELCR